MEEWGGGEGGGVSSVERVGVEESVVWKRLGWRSGVVWGGGRGWRSQ